MSYAAIQRRSDFASPTSLGACGCTGACNGGEMEIDGCCCCPDGTWSNALYLELKGPESLRHLNEVRVNASFEHMTADAVNLAAYDQGASAPGGALRVPIGLVASLKRAVANYQAIYPLSRWAKIQDGSDKGQCGPYNTWQDQPTSGQAASNAAIDNALGAPNQAAHWWTRIEPQVAQLITNVATGGGDAAVASGPPQGNLFINVPAQRDILRADGDTLVPTDWTKAFLNLFASGWEKKISAATRAGAMTKTGVLSLRRTVAGRQAAMQAKLVASDEDAPATKSSIAVIAIVVAAGVMASAAYLHFHR